MSIAVILLNAAAATASPAAALPRCAPVDASTVASWFDGWNLALASLDADRVAQRYWGDAVLLATVSNAPRTTTAAIRDYFVHFLEKHPRGRVDTRTVQLGCNVAVDAGTYSFSMMDETGAVEELSARFTYVYTFRDGQWRISHHHSSAMPEPVPEADAAQVAAASPPPSTDKAGTVPRATNPDPAPQQAAASPPAEPRRAASPLFMNAAASPGVMEFYPIEARVARETGSVGLRVCAGPDGKLVGEPAVLQSSGSERLDVAARNWAKAARWVPATSNRRAVEGCVELTARFEPR